MTLNAILTIPITLKISRHRISVKVNYHIIPIIIVTLNKDTLHNQIFTKTKYFIVFCDMSLPNNLIKPFSIIKEITYYPTTLQQNFGTYLILMDQSKYSKIF